MDIDIPERKKPAGQNIAVGGLPPALPVDRSWREIKRLALRGRGPGIVGYDVLERNGAGDERYQTVIPAPKGAKLGDPGIREFKKGEVKRLFKDMGNPRPVSGFVKQAFNAVGRGAAKTAAAAPIPNAHGQAAMWGLDILGQGRDRVMERGAEFLVENGWSPDPNGSMDNALFGLGSYPAGMVGYGADIYNAAFDKGQGAGIPEEFRLLKRGPQLTAALRLWRNLQANGKDTAEERRRVAMTALEQVDPQRRWFTPDQQDKDESVIDTFGDTLGPILTDTLLQNGSDVAQATRRMQWTANKWDEHWGRPDTSSNTGLESNLLGGIEAAGANITPWAATMGLKSALTQIPFTTASAPGAIMAYDQLSGNEDVETPTEQQNRAEFAASILSNLGPAALYGAGRAIRGGGKWAVDKTKGNNWFNPTRANEQMKIVDGFRKGIGLDAKVSAEIQELVRAGIIPPPPRAAEMGELGAAWIDQLSVAHPDLGAKAKKAFDAHRLDIMRAMRNQSGGLDGGRVLDDKIKHHMPRAEIGVPALRTAADDSIRGRQAEMNRRYNELADTPEMQTPVPPDERKLLAEDIRQHFRANSQEDLANSGIGAAVEETAAFLTPRKNKQTGMLSNPLSVGGILKHRNRIRDRLRAVPESPLKGALKEINKKLTGYLRDYASKSNQTLRQLELDYKEHAQVRDALDPLTGAMAQGSKKMGENLSRALVNERGKINQDVYANFSRAFAGDSKKMAMLNNFVGQQLAKRITNNEEGGRNLMKIIDENFDFLSSTTGDAAAFTDNGRAFDIVAKAISGSVSKLAKSAENVGQKGVSFVSRMTDENQANRVIGAFKKIYGEEDGIAALRWLEGQHILRAKSPSEYFNQHKAALARIYTPEQMKTMGALSFAYENANKFNFRKYMGTPGNSPLEGPMGKIVESLESEFGVSIPMLASNLKLWATRVQGHTYVATSALMRFFNSQNSKRAFNILLTESGRDPEVAKAFMKMNWGNVSKEKATRMWTRLVPTWKSVETETKPERDQIGAEQLRGGDSGRGREAGKIGGVISGNKPANKGRVAPGQGAAIHNILRGGN